MTETVLMVRDPAYNKPPFSCDVHPDEVENYRAGNWVLSSECTFDTESDMKIAAAVRAAMTVKGLMEALTEDERQAVTDQLRELTDPQPDDKPAKETRAARAARLLAEKEADEPPALPPKTAEELAAEAAAKTAAEWAQT